MPSWAGASLRLLAGAALVAMATWPTWALLWVLHAVLLLGGAWCLCYGMGALVAMACSMEDE